MLRLLTDEHVSPKVSKELSRRCKGIEIHSLYSWRKGALLGAPDALVLEEARRDGLTLVAFDLRTIPPLLRFWGEQEIAHAGVILIDESSIAQNDVGGTVTGLAALWDAQGELDWANRVIFLRGAGASKA